MAEHLWTEVDQGQQLQHARPGNPTALGERLDVLARRGQLVMPAVGEPDRLDDVLLRLGLRWDDEVLALRRKQHSPAVKLLDLDVNFKIDPSSTLGGLRPARAGGYRRRLAIVRIKPLSTQQRDLIGVEPSHESFIIDSDATQNGTDPVITNLLWLSDGPAVCCGIPGGIRQAAETCLGRAEITG